MKFLPVIESVFISLSDYTTFLGKFPMGFINLYFF